MTEKHKNVNKQSNTEASGDTHIGGILLEIALSQPDKSGFLSDEQKKEWEAIEDELDIRKITTVEAVKALAAIKAAQEKNKERRQNLIDEVNEWTANTSEVRKRNSKKIQKIFGFKIELE